MPVAVQQLRTPIRIDAALKYPPGSSLPYVAMEEVRAGGEHTFTGPRDEQIHGTVMGTSSHQVHGTYTVVRTDDGKTRYLRNSQWKASSPHGATETPPPAVAPPVAPPVAAAAPAAPAPAPAALPGIPNVTVSGPVLPRVRAMDLHGHQRNDAVGLHQVQATKDALTLVPQNFLSAVYSVEVSNNLVAPAAVGQCTSANEITLRAANVRASREFNLTVAHEATHAAVNRYKIPADVQGALRDLYRDHDQRAREVSRNVKTSVEAVRLRLAWSSMSRAGGLGKPVTSYALTSQGEYFAETFAHYLIAPQVLQRADPRAYEVLSRSEARWRY